MKKLLLTLSSLGILVGTAAGITSCGESESLTTNESKNEPLTTRQFNLNINIDDLFHEQTFDYDAWSKTDVNLEYNKINSSDNGKPIWIGDTQSYLYITDFPFGGGGSVKNLYMNLLLGSYVITESMKQHKPIKRFADFANIKEGSQFYDFHFNIKSGEETCRIDFIHKYFKLPTGESGAIYQRETDFSNCALLDPDKDGKYALKNTMMLYHLKNFSYRSYYAESEDTRTYENSKDMYIWDTNTIDPKYIDSATAISRGIKEHI